MDDLASTYPGVNNTNMYYYFILYVMAFSFRFFKVHTALSAEKTAGQGELKPREKTTWDHYFFLSVDLLYAAGGVVVLLLNKGELRSVVVMAYAALIFLSAMMDSRGYEYSTSVRVGFHVCVAVLVVVATIWAHRPLTAPKEAKSPPASAVVDVPTVPAKLNGSYLVAIPYRDISLETHLGEKGRSLKLVYTVIVEAEDSGRAIKNAIERFWSDDKNAPKPFGRNAQKTEDLVILDESTVAERKADVPASVTESTAALP